MLTRGNSEKGPVSSDIPFVEEILARQAQELLLRRVIYEDVALGVIDSDDNDKVKRALGAGSGETYDERTSFFDVMRQVLPMTAKRISVKAGLLEILLHG